MGGSLQTKKDKSSGNGGIDPEKWESAPAEAVGAVSNASLVAMTGGDAGTYEGIVDYILMQEERDAPEEQSILAAEEVGLLRRNFPAEVESEGSLVNSAPIAQTGSVTANMPIAPSGGLGMDGVSLASGDVGLDGLGVGTDLGGQESALSGVTGFGSLSVASGSGGTEGGLVVPHNGDDLKIFEAMGGPDPSQLSAQNATVIAGMDGMVQGLGGQIDGAVSSAIGSADSAFSGHIGSLDQAFGTNLDLITSSFASARGDVDAAASSAMSSVESSSQLAMVEIDSMSAKLLADADTTVQTAANSLIAQATSTQAAAEGVVSAGQSRAQAIAAQWAKAAAERGKSEATAYRGRGQGGTEGKRNEARAQVAEHFGAGYAEDIPKKGTEINQLLETEKANIRAAIAEMITPLLTVELPTLLQNLHADVTANAESARSAVEKGRDDALESAREHHTAAGEQLEQAESQAITDLTGVHGGTSDSLDAVHTSGTAAIGAMGEGIRSHLLEKSQQMRALIANNPALPLATLREEVELLSGELMEEAVAGQSAIGVAQQELAQSEAELTAEGVSSMNQIGVTASGGASEIAAQATTDLGELSAGFEAGVDEILQGYQSNLDTLRSMLDQNVNAFVTSAMGGLQQTLEGVNNGVGEFLDGFDNDMRTSVETQMVSDLQAKAEEEAAKIKEPSLWDKVCSVVKVLVIVAVIVAITVVTAGAAAPAIALLGTWGITNVLAATVIAGAALGAIGGALTEVAMQIAKVGINPMKWDWKAIGIEGLVGGVVGGLTAGLGVGLKALGTWGTKAVAATNVARSAAITRVATWSAKLVDAAGELSEIGRIASSIGGTLIGEAATAIKDGKLPSIADVGLKIGLNAVTSEFGNGLKELLPSTDPPFLKDCFGSFMEVMSKEASTGESTQKVLENLNIPVVDLGNVKPTTDYKPTWNPTW
jgi:hypothetical protein